MHSAGQVPAPYMELFPFLLAPNLWERAGNITPLVRLLQVKEMALFTAVEICKTIIYFAGFCGEGKPADHLLGQN